MTELILHAGMPKTGTATIQRTLSRPDWDPILAARNIRYLKHRSVIVNHSRYFHSLCGQPGWKSPAVHEHNVSAFSEAFQAVKLDAPAGSSTLVSAEAISPLARHVKHLSRVGRFLARFVSDAAVIVYLREPLSYMCSRIQQGLKTGYPLDSSVENAIADTDYTNWIGNLQNQFGTPNVSIRSYDPAILLDGDIVSDFSIGALKLPDSTALRDLIEARTEHNHGIPAELMTIISALYRERSLTPRDIPGNFAQKISGVRWQGAKFDVRFFSQKDRRRLVAAADEARDRTREYLRYDCFPSFRPPRIDESDRLPVPDEPEVYGQHIRLLEKLLHDLGDTPDKRRDTRPPHPGVDPPGGARSETGRLLGRLLQLCTTAKTRKAAS